MSPPQSDIRELDPRLHRDTGLDSTDDTEIDALLKALYEVISFEEGGEPEWERMRGLFSPNARITRVTPEGTDYLDVAGFQEFAQEMLDLGTYTSFYEYEVTRTVQRFGAVAHVLSAYATKANPGAREPFARGVNSIQLIKEDHGWRVLSLFWDEERSDNPLHLDQLFSGGDAHV